MSRNNTVLVSGAMGQLGRRLTKVLLDRGRTVVALDLRTKATLALTGELKREPSQAGALVPAFVDLLDAAAVLRWVAEHRPSVIVHLAAVVAPVCYKNPKFARRVNVEGTRNLVEAAEALPERSMFVMVSSSAVYGSRNPHRHAERISWCS